MNKKRKKTFVNSMIFAFAIIALMFFIPLSTIWISNSFFFSTTKIWSFYGIILFSWVSYVVIDNIRNGKVIFRGGGTIKFKEHPFLTGLFFLIQCVGVFGILIYLIYSVLR